MRFADVKSWAEGYLAALRDPDGQLVYTPYTPMVLPGPASDAIVQKSSPNELVFLTLGGGAGMTTEGLFDQPFLSVRAIGRQNDFTGAENLAYFLDAGLLAFDSNGIIGNAPVLRVARSGGAPALLMMDDASRYHFTCSYIVETQTEGAFA